MTGFYQIRIYRYNISQPAKMILQSSVLVPKPLLTFDSKDKVTEPEGGPGFSICSWGCITSTRSHEGNRPAKQSMPHLQTNIAAPLLSQGLVHGQTLQYSVDRASCFRDKNAEGLPYYQC